MTNFQPFDPLSLVASEGNELIRTQIRNLFDSYNGEWDIIIELLQNAVDALDAKYSGMSDFTNERPEIDIYINQQTETIRVSDNGIGIAPEDARKILAPNFTKKPRSRNAKRFRGHKGVGLTYIAYFGNHLRYATKSTSGEFKAEINNTKTWVYSSSTDEVAPKLKPTDFNPSFYSTHRTGSSFEVQLDSQHLSRKNINWLGWEFIIRNYTAIGFCCMEEYPIWAQHVKVNLSVIDKYGTEIQPPIGKSSQLEFKFQFPHEVMGPSVNLRDLLTRYQNQASIPVTEKNKYVGMYQEWNIDQIGELTNEADIISFAKEYDAKIYGYFGHTAKIWKGMNGLLTVDNRRKFWKPGIQVVTENMPTGRILDIDLTFGGGNKDRAYVVIELDGARPDYGRKTFDEQVTAFVQYIASRIISHFVHSREILRSTDVANGGTISEQQYNADIRIEYVRELEDLSIAGLPFIKVPQYEQDIVGLFHVLIGANKLKGYQIMSVSSGAQYDGVVKYYLTKNNLDYYDEINNPLGIIESNYPRDNSIKVIPKNLEFKYYLSDLILQFDPNDPSSKVFDDIYWAVAWDRGDTQAYTNSGYYLDDLTIDNMHTKRHYYGVTHLLYSQGNRPINVILLKDVIRLLKRGH